MRRVFKFQARLDMHNSRYFNFENHMNDLRLTTFGGVANADFWSTMTDAGFLKANDNNFAAKDFFLRYYATTVSNRIAWAGGADNYRQLPAPLMRDRGENSGEPMFPEAFLKIWKNDNISAILGTQNFTACVGAEAIVDNATWASISLFVEVYEY